MALIRKCCDYNLYISIYTALNSLVSNLTKSILQTTKLYNFSDTVLIKFE